MLTGKKKKKKKDYTFSISTIPFIVTTGIKETIIFSTKKVGRNRLGQQHQPTWGRQNLWYAFSQDGTVCTRQESV